MKDLFNKFIYINGIKKLFRKRRTVKNQPLTKDANWNWKTSKISYVDIMASKIFHSKDAIPKCKWHIGIPI